MDVEEDFRDCLQTHENSLTKSTEFVFHNLQHFTKIFDIIVKEAKECGDERRPFFLRLVDAVAKGLWEGACFPRHLQRIKATLPEIINDVLTHANHPESLSTLQEMVEKWKALGIFGGDSNILEKGGSQSLPPAQPAPSKPPTSHPRSGPISESGANSSTNHSTSSAFTPSPKRLQSSNSPRKKRRLEPPTEEETEAFLRRKPTSDSDWLKYIEFHRRRNKKVRWDASLRQKGEPTRTEFEEMWEREQVPASLKRRVDIHFGKAEPIKEREFNPFEDLASYHHSEPQSSPPGVSHKIPRSHPPTESSHTAPSGSSSSSGSSLASRNHGERNGPTGGGGREEGYTRPPPPTHHHPQHPPPNHSQHPPPANQHPPHHSQPPLPPHHQHPPPAHHHQYPPAPQHQHHYSAPPQHHQHPYPPPPHHQQKGTSNGFSTGGRSGGGSWRSRSPPSYGHSFR